MFGAKSSSNSNLSRSTILGVMLFAVIFVLLPIFAGAQCAKWDAGGLVVVAQQGQAFTITLTLEQKGSVITGTADALQWTNGDHKGTKTLGGTVDGTIEGNSFNIQIFWRNGQTGVYNAKVLPSGRLDGEGYEVNTPNVRVRWHSDGVLKCAPPPPPPPLRATGKARPSEPVPALKPPWITASRAVFPVPSVPTGFVVLTWDAGPAHPNAQVWLGKQIVAQGGKGGLQMPVARGQHYQYMLVDADKAFAMVSFIAVGP